jgi:metal-responsive CopG/Arc/MetJ family transcriptional regulator
MKTAVSIPDEIFQEAERLRQKSGASRSALYAEAIRTYLDQRRRPNRTPGSWAGRFEVHESEEDAIASDPDVLAAFDESAEAAEAM